MKRRAEFVLGIITVVLGILGIVLSLYSLKALSSPETVDMMTSIGGMDMDQIVAESIRTTHMNSIIAGVLTVIVLIATLMIRKDRASLFSGVLFLGAGSFGFFYGFGLYVGCLIAIVAGILSVVREAKKEELFNLEEVEEG